MTNAEWIRNLDDRQLTNFLRSVIAIGFHNGRIDEYDERNWRNDDIRAEECPMDIFLWLQSEVQT